MAVILRFRFLEGGDTESCPRCRRPQPRSGGATQLTPARLMESRRVLSRLKRGAKGVPGTAGGCCCKVAVPGRPSLLLNVSGAALPCLPRTCLPETSSSGNSDNFPLRLPLRTLCYVRTLRLWGEMYTLPNWSKQADPPLLLFALPSALPFAPETNTKSETPLLACSRLRWAVRLAHLKMPRGRRRCCANRRLLGPAAAPAWTP